MVWKLSCDCDEREGIMIDSVILFQKMKDFFDRQVKAGIFTAEDPKIPYYVWKEGTRIKTWYATKWYKCKVCGCLWEINDPDFPAKGFVRKFSDGIYKERGF